MHRLLVAGALAVSLILPIADARAGTVVMEDEVLVFKGTGDEKNSVRLSGAFHEEYGPMISIYDGDSAITAVDTDYCFPVSEGSTACLYGALGVRLELGGGDDWARIDRAFDQNGTTVAMPLTMLGGAGNDTLADENSVTAARRYEGGPGNDTISAEDGTDVVLGADGNDVLDGGAGDDEVRGGEGDDTVRGDRYAEPGADIVDGGPGRDLGDEWNDPARSDNPPVTIVQDGAPGDGRPGENDNVTSIERFSNGSHGTIEGTAGADSIVTWGNGDSTIRGLDGADEIQTGSKKDTITGGGGADDVSAGFGDDVITGGAGADVIAADGGNVYCGYYTCEVPFGNDKVYVRDGEVDSVDCGVGQDFVEADAGDVVAANCETVERPSAGGSTPGGGGGGPAPGGGDGGSTPGPAEVGDFGFALLSKKSVRALLRSGLTFSVKCPAACEVRGRLLLKGKPLGAGAKAALAGGTVKVRVKVSKKARRRLKRLKKASLTLTVTVGDAAGKSTTFSKALAFKK